MKDKEDAVRDAASALSDPFTYDATQVRVLSTRLLRTVYSLQSTHKAYGNAVRVCSVVCSLLSVDDEVVHVRLCTVEPYGKSAIRGIRA